MNPFGVDEPLLGEVSKSSKRRGEAAAGGVLAAGAGTAAGIGISENERARRATRAAGRMNMQNLLDSKGMYAGEDFFSPANHRRRVTLERFNTAASNAKKMRNRAGLAAAGAGLGAGLLINDATRPHKVKKNLDDDIWEAQEHRKANRAEYRGKKLEDVTPYKANGDASTLGQRLNSAGYKNVRAYRRWAKKTGGVTSAVNKGAGMNPFGVDDGGLGDISKHLIGHHTRPTDRHTRDQHKQLRQAKGRVQGEYYAGVDRASRKAADKWDNSKEGKADAYARTFHEATRGMRDDYQPLPANPSRQNAVNAGVNRWKDKPKAQNLSAREARLQRAYRNKPISKGFGVDEPLLSYISKGSVEQGLRMVGAASAGKGGPAVRTGSFRSPFGGAKRKAWSNLQATRTQIDRGTDAVADSARVSRSVNAQPGGGINDGRMPRALAAQRSADSTLRQGYARVGRDRAAVGQLRGNTVFTGPGYAASGGARSLQWQARQAANSR
jgi:hypothetical protein